MNILGGADACILSHRDKGLGAFAVSRQQLNSAFNLAQCITAGAITAQPEVFQGGAFGVLRFGVEAEEPSTIHAHQRLGALRIGTLRDHESVAKLHTVGRKLFAPCRLQSRAAEDGWQRLPRGAVNFFLLKSDILLRHIFLKHKGTQRG